MYDRRMAEPPAKRLPEWILATVAVATLAVTYTGIRSQSQATRESLDLTRKSLDITRDGLELTRRSLELSQRPWLVIDRVDFSKDDDRDEEMTQIHVVWKNIGAGPAREVRAAAMLADDSIRRPQQFEKPVEFTVDMDFGDRRFFYESRNVVSVGETMDMNQIMSLDHRQRVRIGSRLAIFARVDFKDVFGKPHWYIACRELRDGKLSACAHSDETNSD